MVSRWYQSDDSHKVAKHWILSKIASSSTRVSNALWTRKAASLSQEYSAGTHHSSQQQRNLVIAVRREAFKAPFERVAKADAHNSKLSVLHHVAKEILTCPHCNAITASFWDSTLQWHPLGIALYSGILLG